LLMLGGVRLERGITILDPKLPDFEGKITILDKYRLAGLRVANLGKMEKYDFEEEKHISAGWHCYCATLYNVHPCWCDQKCFKIPF